MLSRLFAYIFLFFLSTAFGGACPAAWQHPMPKFSTDSGLTAADVVAPDGLVYPDFSMAGIPEGIDAAITKRTEFPVTNGAGDDTNAVRTAVAAASAAGGGIVKFAPGEYELSGPVFIFSDDVVLQGAGMEETSILYKNHITPVAGAEGSIKFLDYLPYIFSGANVDVQVYTAGLTSVSLKLNNVEIRLYSDLNTAGVVLGNNYTFEATATWGTTTKTISRTVQYVDRDSVSPKLGYGDFYKGVSVFHFSGPGRLNGGGSCTVLDDVPRGSFVAYCHSSDAGLDFSAGDHVQLSGKATPNYLAANTPMLVTLARHQKFVLANASVVTAGYTGTPPMGDTVYRLEFTQPSRLKHVAGTGADGNDPLIGKEDLLERVGLQDLTLEQETNPSGQSLAENQPFYGVSFIGCYKGFLRNVKIRRMGNWPLQAVSSHHLEVRNSQFIQAWRADASQGYVGIGNTHDSLHENNLYQELRHAPDIQGSSSGNVVRFSRIIAADMQQHRGIAYENLFETSYTNPRNVNMWNGNGVTGAYGYACYVHPGDHDPTVAPGGGPRVVHWGNDCDHWREAVRQGNNANAIVAYNRFLQWEGNYGFALLNDDLSNMIFQGNVYSSLNSKPVLFNFGDGSNTQITPLQDMDACEFHLRGNLFYVGDVNMSTTNLLTDPFVEDDSQKKPYTPLPDFVDPPFSSLYGWQKGLPSVIIKEPLTHQVTTLGRPVTIKVEAKPGRNGGAISKVEFFNNGTLIGEVTSPTQQTDIYELQYITQFAGEHKFKARAYAAGGATDWTPWARVHNVTRDDTLLPYFRDQLLVWFRADSESMVKDATTQRISAWRDRWTSGYTLISDPLNTTYDGFKPVWVEDAIQFGGRSLPAVRFSSLDGLCGGNLRYGDAQGDYLSMRRWHQVREGDPRSVFLVFKQEENYGRNTIWGSGWRNCIRCDNGDLIINDRANQINYARTVTGGCSMGDLHIISVHSDGANHTQVFMDGTQILDERGSGTPLFRWWLHQSTCVGHQIAGASYRYSIYGFKGIIAEYVAYRAFLSDQQRSAVYSYLSAYYSDTPMTAGPTLAPTSNPTSGPTAVPGSPTNSPTPGGGGNSSSIPTTPPTPAPSPNNAISISVTLKWTLLSILISFFAI